MEKTNEIKQKAAEKPTVVPFVTFERAEASYERHIKRYWILALVLLGLLVASNVAWLVFISQYDFESYQADIDAGQGDALYNYIGNDMKGDINNGTYQSEKDKDNTDNGSTGQDDPYQSY